MLAADVPDEELSGMLVGVRGWPALIVPILSIELPSMQIFQK